MSAKLWVSVVFTSSLIIHLVSAAAADDGEGRREISASIPALCCSPNLQVSCKRRTVVVIFIVLYSRYSTSLVIIIELYVGKCYLVIHTVCIKKKATFEIQISHNYSDLIVLKCVELMTRDKKRVLFTKAINRSCPIKRKSFVLRLAK